MSSFVIKIAGVPILVEHRYDYIRRICADYISDDTPEISVSASDDRISEEREKASIEASLALCEAVCLHREIVKALVKYEIVLMHSAAIAVDGEAYVFLAKSGVGKSTHINFWKQLFGDRAIVINGDKPMFSFAEGRLFVHGSPWRGKEGWGENTSAPVKAFCFLSRGIENEIKPSEPSETVTKLFYQLLLPAEASELNIFLNLIDRIIKEVPFYSLKCNISIEAAILAHKAMSKE